MDKILEKLGVYDLTVLLFTGMIMLLITIKIFPFLNADIKFSVDDPMQFLIISYFAGMVFQELGSKLNGRKLLKTVFRITKDSRLSLSQKEIDFIKKTVCDKLDISFSEDAISEIYDYCKLSYMKLNKTTIEIDKQQLIGGMARSLSIYFILCFGVAMIKYFVCVNIIDFYISIVCLYLSYIFYNRYVRFFKMRYTLILRSFYYENSR